MTPALVALAMTLSLGAGKGDGMVAAEVGPLKLRVPRGWKATVEDGTRKWESPDGRQSFSLDVFTPDAAPLGPGECVDKLVEALGGDKWERRVVGGQPAARRIFIDKLEDGRPTATHSHVGCDGRTRWALTYVQDARRKVKPPVDQVVDSIRFGGKAK
jgi:hypothetical protein